MRYEESPLGGSVIIGAYSYLDGMPGILAAPEGDAETQRRGDQEHPRNMGEET